MPVTRPYRILITGGRGRLAAFLGDRLRALGHEVVLFSRTGGPGFHEPAELLSPETHRGSDVLLHLAWSTLPAKAEEYPRSEWEQDLPRLEKMLGTLAAVRAGGRPHLVFLSSGGTVYGNAPGRPSRETDPGRPIGAYGRAKLAAEQLIEECAGRHNLPRTILRLSNPYGHPMEPGRRQGLVALAVHCALTGEPLELHGDGSARKDFVYCSDFLAAMQGVITTRPAGIFNLGTGESHRVSEVLELVERHTGRTIPLRHSPSLAWDVQDSRLDITRFCAATGWHPIVSLDEGIGRAVADYRAG